METQFSRLSLKQREEAEVSNHLVKRPVAGKVGRPLRVLANYCAIEAIPSKDIIHYDISFEPVPPVVLQKIIFHSMLKAHSNELGNVAMAYDGKANVYTAGQLPQNTYSFDVIPEDEKQRKNPRRFTVRLKKVNLISMQLIKSFLSGKLDYTPYEALQALEIVLQKVPNELFVAVGRSYFSGKNRFPISGPVEIWQGYFQSIRPSIGRLLINVDSAYTAFYKGTSLLEIFKTADRRKLESQLKNLRFGVTHRNTPRKYSIRGFSAKGANATEFLIVEDQKSTIAQYFEKQYNYKLKYPELPCVKTGSTDRPIFFPLEVCVLVDGQKFSRKLSEDQTAEMIKIAACKPHERLEQIRNGLTELHIGPENQTLKAFGIKINKQLIEIKARVLNAPVIQYSKNGRDSTIVPKCGVWNLKDKIFEKGAVVKSWAVVNFSRSNPREVEEFIREHCKWCQNSGLVHEVKHPFIVTGTDRLPEVEGTLREAYRKAEEKCCSPAQLLFVVLPSASSAFYGEVKRVCDTVLGVNSQCMLPKNLRNRSLAQYCANLALKINMKLGGINSSLADPIPFITQKPTIVFGADVTHPGIGDRGRPSIAAVVASMDIKLSRYITKVTSQDSRVEVINDLQSTIKAQLIAFYNANKAQPARILYFRDGVSEGQFSQILQKEVAAIKRACADLSPAYKPPITAIIAQKRHHTRLFPASSQDADRSGNIPAGTVVDTDITHTNHYDFFMNSHAGIQGTNRPCHYHVILDENSIGPDAIQDMIFKMCHTYARCTRSVSLVPPCYYADLAAARARHHAPGDEYSVSSSGDSAEPQPTAAFVPVKQGLEMYYI